MGTKIRVMLVEDHPEYRDVVELALRKEPDIELTSQFGTSEGALRELQDTPKSREVDVILLDLNLPGMSGLEAIPWFREFVPKARIIILTQSDAEADVLQAIKLGAAGYLLKSSTVDKLRTGIRTVSEGGASLDAGVAKFILTTLQARMPDGDEPQAQLSEREMEILTLLAEGLVKKEIAKKLGIGTSTVITHVAHIYEKLGATNAPSAINQAHKLGLFRERE